MSGHELSRIGGASPSHVFFHRYTTRHVASADRLDYWRQLFTAPRIDTPNPSSGYQGELLRSASHGGVAFVNLRADANVCRFGKRESGLVLLGCVQAGRFELRHGRDQATVVQPRTGLVLFDSDQSVSMSATRHDMSYLVLPRSLVISVMGGDPIARGGGGLQLPNDGLAPILRAHLEAMAAHGECLDAFAARAAVQAAGSLALALLAGALRQRIDHRALDEALFAAACRYLEWHAGNPALTADDIAARLGCSRAHLYRVFSRRGRTIAGNLRDLRLKRARHLLETRLLESVGEIAFRCGYTDLSAFGKAFRRQFGMTPTECRLMARAASLRT